jgi:hypothetical protein
MDIHLVFSFVFYHDSENMAIDNAAKQENFPLGGVDYDSLLEIYSHS